MIIISILLLTLLCVAPILVIFDLVLLFREWQSRIRIGRWEDRIEWQKAIEKRAKKWLRRSPTVKIHDHTRWMLIDMLFGQYRNKTIQSWQDAGLLLGLEKEDSVRYVARRIDMQTGDWRKKPQYIDAALLAYVLKKNGTLPSQAEKSVFEMIAELRGDQKTIPYRASIPDIRFVDTIGMVAPFLTIYGESKLADLQIKEYDRSKLPDSSIPSHAFDLTHNVPLGIYDWGRGAGWYILGLVESNDDGRYNDRIVALAEELLRYQKPDGGFGAMYFNLASATESSGTALIGLLMSRCYRVNGDQRFIDAAIKIEKRLMSSTRRNGALDYCQGDTKGIGYYSLTFSVMPFAQGIALRLSKELNDYAHR